MGTFGTGAFDSDGALDFLDELAGRPARDRQDALSGLFARVVRHPDLLWREFFPDGVVAAAALVAASLPGGEDLRQRLVALVDNEITQDAQLPVPTPDLAMPALAALLLVAAPGGPWHEGWTTETSAVEATQTIEDLVKVLRPPRAEHPAP